jgi:hypothetical protein
MAKSENKTKVQLKTKPAREAGHFRNNPQIIAQILQGAMLNSKIVI